MITACPHCGRSVHNEEKLVRVAGRWEPTLCCREDRAGIPDAVASNSRYWYTSCQNDKGSHRLLTGPFASYEQAEAALPSAKRNANDVDYRAAFYGYGIAGSNAILATAFDMPSALQEIWSRR